MASDDNSDIEDNDNDGEVSAAEAESIVRVATWNIRGLASHKQKLLLHYTAQLNLDVLALCETHLLQQEQLVEWEKNVSLPESKFVWFGRQAVKEKRYEHGRGSGGVGLLIRRDWLTFCTEMPVCDHPCLLFVRLELPDAPFPIYFGSAYAVPIGSAREASNKELLSELEEISAQYKRLGMVVVCGDFNTHIACIPSTILISPIDNVNDEEDELEVQVKVLERNSIDVPVGVLVDAEPAAGAAFMDWMDTVGLVVLNGLCAVGDGRKAEATFGVRSVIDFILVDADHWRLMDSVKVEFGACAEVASDHQLVRSELKYNPVADRVRHIVEEAAVSGNVSYLINSTRYCTATKGNPNHFEEFEGQCREVLPGLVRSWTERARSEEGVQVEAAWAEFTSKVDAVCASTLGVRRKRKSKGDSIRRAHGEVRQWIQQRKAIWRRINQLLPSEREVRRRMELELRPLNTRIKHHMRNQARVEQMQQMDRVLMLRRAQMREHWRELKRIGNLQEKALAVPDTVLDNLGVEQESAEEVRRQWREAWGKLAQHRSDDPRYDSEFHDHIESEEHIEREEEPTAAEVRLNDSITREEVRESIRRLHRGKAEGCDGISAEVLKEGGETMILCLHYLCSLVFKAAEVPMDWLRGVVVPLYKDGDRRVPLNYRPITLLSLVGKVYTGVLCARLTDWAEKRGVLVEEQGGFRARRGCPEQVFALTELIKMRQRMKLDTYACFIDIKKAYDTVWHSGLKDKLKRYGIHGRMYAAICSLYAGCESTIRLGGVLGYTDFFPIETGVRQGCILSPLLYSLFINDVAIRLKEENNDCGVPVGPERRLVVLLYADDIVLLSESESGVASLMAAVHAYSVQWRFDVNHAKCGLMCFRWQGSRLPTSEIRLGERKVEWVSVYKYLGIELHCGIAFKQYRKRAILSAHRAGNAVSGMGMYSGKLGVLLGVQVYKAMVRPLIEYCAEVWSVAAWKEADRLQSTMAKRILGVSTRCSSTAVRGELGWISMDARWQKARLNFWGKIQFMSEDSPARLVYEASAVEFAKSEASDRLLHSTPLVEPEEGFEVVYAAKRQGDSSLPWCAQIQTDIAQLGQKLQEVWRKTELLAERGGITLEKWRQEVAKVVRTRDQHHWWRCVEERPTLSIYRQLKKNASGLVLEKYLSVPHGGWNDLGLIGRRALTRIRCGHHELRICTGAWEGLDVEDRWCPMCAEAVETEEHFLLDCAHWKDERAVLYHAIDAMVTTARSEEGDRNAFLVAQLSRDEQWRLMTGGVVSKVGKEEIRGRVIAKILTSVAQWSLDRKESLASIERARRE